MLAPIEEMIGTQWRLAQPMCMLPSLPLVRPATRPVYWATLSRGVMPRMSRAAMSRWEGVSQSPGCDRIALPTGIASWPRPV